LDFLLIKKKEEKKLISLSSRECMRKRIRIHLRTF
jgi:hypothetical protein